MPGARIGRAALILGLGGGCDPAATIDPPRVDAAEPADPSDAAPPDAPGAGASFEHDWGEAELCAVVGNPESGCCAGPRLELPATAASVLDLRGLTSGAAGTCGDPVKQMLPADASAYPLMVLLPAISAADPLCATACEGRGTPTTFGVVLELPAALTATYRPLVVAPPPWRYVYDHNSLAGDACLGGYQEFGERACVRPNYGGSIGFATAAASTPTRAALVDLQVGDNGVVETCCPYLPTR